MTMGQGRRLFRCVFGESKGRQQGNDLIFLVGQTAELELIPSFTPFTLAVITFSLTCRKASGGGESWVVNNSAARLVLIPTRMAWSLVGDIDFRLADS